MVFTVGGLLGLFGLFTAVLGCVGGVGFLAFFASAAFVVAVACAVCFLLHGAHLSFCWCWLKYNISSAACNSYRAWWVPEQRYLALSQETVVCGFIGCVLREASVWPVEARTGLDGYPCTPGVSKALRSLYSVDLR